MTRLAGAGLALAAIASGCGGSSVPEPAGRPAGSGAATGKSRACGELERCDRDELCVETRGAVCMPLPPPGGSCSEGCVPTEHCCNCSAFACLAARASGCPDGPSCGCLDALGSFLEACGPDRRECSETPAGVDVLCIDVAFDEDPFADAG